MNGNDKVLSNIIVRIFRRASLEIAVKLLLAVFLFIVAIIISHFPTISPTVCSIIRSFIDISCQVRGSDNALEYSNVYRIESFEDYFPGSTSATARTEDGMKVWTSFTRVVPDEKHSHDHIIYAIIEPRHLDGNSCILLHPGIWPSENPSKKKNTKWEHTYIVLKTDLLKQDKINDSSIVLKPLDQGASDPRVEFYVNGSVRGGLRGVLEKSCSAAKKNINYSSTEAYRLVATASAQSGSVSDGGNKKKQKRMVLCGISL